MEPDAIVALASQLLGGGVVLIIINGNARTEGRGETGEKERSQLLRGVESVRVAGRGDEHLVNDPGVIIELLLLLLQGYEFY